MNREIKFRGLNINDKEWIYGGISIFENDTTIFDCNCMVNSAYEVFGYSVGQFTGLKDKNGKEIYEGDMFNPDTVNEEVAAVVRWDDESAKFVIDGYAYACGIGEGNQEVYDSEISVCETTDLSDVILEYCEIIGNIHDNPELLS